MEEKNRNAAEEEYRRSGWKEVNDLLSYFEQKDLLREETVWFENWEQIRDLKQCLGSDLFLELLNEDSQFWRFEKTKDGTIVAVKTH